MQSAPTKTSVRVQTQGGQTIGLDQVKSIRLNDGWHNLEECTVNYLDRAGQSKEVPFSEIQAFSDKPEGNSQT